MQSLVRQDLDTFLASTARVAAGSLGGVISRLRRPTRDEAQLACLILRALDAFEDLGDIAVRRENLRCATLYFCGRTSCFPAFPSTSSRRVDRVAEGICERATELRAALTALPSFAKGRLEQLIGDVSGGMDELLGAGLVFGPEPLRRYCDRVLGRVVGYALELVTGEEPPQLGCRAVGRVLQAANWLRDEAFDRAQGSPLHAAGPASFRASMIRLLGPELAFLPGLMLWEPLVRSAEARACVARIAIGCIRSLLRSFGAPISGWAKIPLLSAWSAGRSERAYRGLCAWIAREAFLLALWELQDRTDTDPRARFRRRALRLTHPDPDEAALEARAVARYPDALGRETLGSVAVMVHLIECLIESMPTAPGFERHDGTSGVMLFVDYSLVHVLQKAAALSPEFRGVIGKWVVRFSAAHISGWQARASVRSFIEDAVARATRSSPRILPRRAA